MPAEIRIEFEPPSASPEKLVREPEISKDNVPAVKVCSPSPPLTSSTCPVALDEQPETTSSTSQGFLSIDSGVRLRSSSQDSHHSVPKSWSDFESEAKKWKVSLEVSFNLFFYSVTGGNSICLHVRIIPLVCLWSRSQGGN